jgi:hypothetical protein
MRAFPVSARSAAIAALLVISLAWVSSACAATEKELLLPKTPGRGRGVNDYNDPNSEFSYKRCVQGPDVAILWSKEYGADPLKVADPNKTFDVNAMLSECERFYKTYVDDLKLVVKGKSVSDKYKLVVLVIGGPGGTAFGGGEGDIGTLSTPATRVHKQPYGVLAHEMMHCFQSISRRDGARGGGINGEMAAQYGLWQNLPEWMTFENYHLVALMDQTHLAFDHPSNMYHTAQVMEYWAFKHGQDFYGNMMRSTEQGDAVTIYKKMYNVTQDQFNDEMFDAYRRFMTWDLPRIEKVARQYANQHHTKMNKADDGWYRIADAKCPQDYGYNGIKLKVPAAGTKVVLDFKGVPVSDANGPASAERAGWRYGFVASLKDGGRVYGDVGRNPQDTTTFQVSENTEYLWLVVMGAPKEHVSTRMGRGGSRGGGGGGSASGPRQPEWPYQIKLTGTSPDDSVIQ